MSCLRKCATDQLCERLSSNWLAMVTVNMYLQRPKMNSMIIFIHLVSLSVMLCFKAWSHRRTDMYRKDNGLKYAKFGYPVTKFISSAARSSRDRYVEPRS